MEFIPDFSQLDLFVTKEDILSKISEEDIYKRFCSDFPSRSIRSPLPGHHDKTPSFGFFQVERRWLWKDQALGISGDVFRFVEKMEHTDFEGALRKISQAFNIESDFKPYKRLIVHRDDSKPVPEEERAVLEAVRQPLSDFDYNIWARWNVSSAAMRYLNIFAAKEIWLRKPKEKVFKIWARYVEHNPVYYWTHPYTTHIKAYKPFEKEKRAKWINNCDNFTDIQGYAQCRIKEFPGRPLLVTSSMKEVGFFRGFGINAMAGHTESSRFTPDFIRHLRKYCNPIISAYDGDPPGVKAAMFLRKEYKIPIAWLCRAHHTSKDPTDRWMEDYKDIYVYLNRLNEIIHANK